MLNKKLKKQLCEVAYVITAIAALNFGLSELGYNFLGGLYGALGLHAYESFINFYIIGLSGAITLYKALAPRLCKACK